MVAFQRLLAEPRYPCWTSTWLSYFHGVFLGFCYLFFFFFWVDGLTNCWVLVFFNGFGPTARWPWAHHALPAVPWCCLPTSHLPPHSHLQSAGVQLISAEHSPFSLLFCRERSSDRQGHSFQAYWLQWSDFSFYLHSRQSEDGREHRWRTSEELSQHFCAILCPPQHLWPEVSAGWDTCQGWRSSENGNITVIQRCDCSSYLSHLQLPALVLTAIFLHRLCKSAQDPGWALGWGCPQHHSSLVIPLPGDLRCTQDGKPSHSPPPEQHNGKGVNQNAWNLLVLWRSKCSCWLAGWKGCKQTTQPPENILNIL